MIWVICFCCEFLDLRCEYLIHLLLLWISWFVLCVTCYCCQYLGLCWVICCCFDSCGPGYSLNIYFSRPFRYIEGPSFSPYKPLQNVDFSKVANVKFFFRNCTHILTRTQEKKLEDMFFVKITSEGTSFTLKKWLFVSRIVLLYPKLSPCQCQKYSSWGKFFHFQSFWNVSMRKERQQPPWLINFAKIWSEHVLKIKTKSQKFGLLIERFLKNANCEFGHPASEPLHAPSPPPPDLIGLTGTHTSEKRQA